MRIPSALGLLAVFVTMAGCSADPAPSSAAGGHPAAGANDSADTSGAGADTKGAAPTTPAATNAPATFSLVGTYYPKSASGSAAAAHWADFAAIDFKDDTRYVLLRPKPCAIADGQPDSCETTGIYVATSDALTLKDDVTGTSATYQLQNIVLGSSGSEGTHIQANLFGSSANLLPGVSTASMTDAGGGTTQVSALQGLGICQDKTHLNWGYLVRGSCDNLVTS